MHSPAGVQPSVRSTVITGLLLDFDDTLIDTRAAMVAAGQAAVARLWPHLGSAAQRAAGVHFHADPRGCFGRFTTGELSFAQMRQARLADLMESLSLAPVDEVGERFEGVYGPAFLANVHLFDDVWPLVEVARTAGIPVGLLTNSSSEYTRQKLEVTGLAGVFDVVVTRDTLGFGKPDPRAFHHACRLLGSAPPDTAYVGDHVEIDAIAASEAGLCAAWLHRDPGDSPDPDPDPGDAFGSSGAERAHARGIPVVTSLSQVAALLAGMDDEVAVALSPGGVWPAPGANTP
jgi:putative hydrolase of the HAD superfamily